MSQSSMSPTTSPFPSFSLVTIHSLMTPRGLLLNGRIATVISHNHSTSRIELIILPASTTDKPQGRAIKPSNLRPCTHPLSPNTPPYLAYAEILKSFAAASSETPSKLHDSKRACDLLFQLPAYLPTLGERAMYANVCREMGQPQRATEILVDVVREAAQTDDTNVNYFRYDLGAAYLNARMISKALQATISIDTTRSADPAHKKIKVDLLQMVGSELRYLGDPQEADVCRAILAEKPDHGVSLWNLGAVLCRNDRTAEGVEAYRRALEHGTGLSDEERRRIARDKEMGEMELEGKFDGKVVGVLAGGQVLTMPSDIALVSSTASGLASQIIRGSSSQSASLGDSTGSTQRAGSRQEPASRRK